MRGINSDIPLYVFRRALKTSKVFHGKRPQKQAKPIQRNTNSNRVNQIRANSNTAILLARLLYSEAAGDSHYSAGRDILRAIAWVIKNRVNGHTHPNSYSSVIYQKGRTGKPHFRGLPGGDNSYNWNNFPVAKGGWNIKAKNESIKVANEILAGNIPDPTSGSEWFRFRKYNKINPKVFIEKEILAGRLFIKLKINTKQPPAQAGGFERYTSLYRRTKPPTERESV